MLAGTFYPKLIEITYNVCKIERGLLAQNMRRVILTNPKERHSQYDEEVRQISGDNGGEEVPRRADREDEESSDRG